jgi:acetyl-CoA synthetase
MTDPQPAWVPDPDIVARANLSWLMRSRDFGSYEDLHRWTTRDRSGFWGVVVGRLGVVFRTPPSAVLEGDARSPAWFPGARLNIVDSCFTAAPEHIAVVYRRDGEVRSLTYADLRTLVDRFADGFVAAGFSPGDRVAISMPMNVEAITAYLGTIAAGGVVVSIADSFAAYEIGTRLDLTDPVAVVTQDRVLRGGRELPMYTKVMDAGARACIVVDTGAGIPIRDEDTSWERFLGSDVGFEPVAGDPTTHINILFSSGTTGKPKAIPWNHLTPIKAAMDGHFHHDIHTDDVVAWPTNLGWMMGPWLIYAALINDATLALYDDAPGDRGFTEFVAAAGVTVLGFVPSIVASWRASGALDAVDWSGVRILSSTGEASNPGDYEWLMTKAAGPPVIEYCGGTEIGGGYLTGTVLQPAYAAQFSTPALGLDVRILDDEGEPVDSGELFLVPPSVGLSADLLNRDHHEVYHAGVPVADVSLRRHGDHVERLANGYYRALGRIDDTMNLGGIKVSSAGIERAIAGVPGVAEVAVIAVPPPGGGPSRLVVYAVPVPGEDPDVERWKADMQTAISAELNPLFRVHDVVAVAALPRTASAKVMRRELRDEYVAS